MNRALVECHIVYDNGEQHWHNPALWDWKTASDDGVTSREWQRISARCCISLQPLTSPARGNECLHPSCCNYEELKTSAALSRTCPVVGCPAQIRLTRFIVHDEALSNALHQARISAPHGNLPSVLYWEPSAGLLRMAPPPARSQQQPRRQQQPSQSSPSEGSSSASVKPLQRTTRSSASSAARRTAAATRQEAISLCSDSEGEVDESSGEEIEEVEEEVVVEAGAGEEMEEVEEEEQEAGVGEECTPCAPSMTASDDADRPAPACLAADTDVKLCGTLGCTLPNWHSGLHMVPFSGRRVRQPSAIIAASTSPAHAKAIAEAARSLGVTLGCPKCRHSEHGCIRCRVKMGLSTKGPCGTEALPDLTRQTKISSTDAYTADVTTIVSASTAAAAPASLQDRRKRLHQEARASRSDQAVGKVLDQLIDRMEKQAAKEEHVACKRALKEDAEARRREESVRSVLYRVIERVEKQAAKVERKRERDQEDHWERTVRQAMRSRARTSEVRRVLDELVDRVVEENRLEAIVLTYIPEELWGGPAPMLAELAPPDSGCTALVAPARRRPSPKTMVSSMLRWTKEEEDEVLRIARDSSTLDWQGIASRLSTGRSAGAVKSRFYNELGDRGEHVRSVPGEELQDAQMRALGIE